MADHEIGSAPLVIGESDMPVPFEFEPTVGGVIANDAAHASTHVTNLSETNVARQTAFRNWERLDTYRLSG